MGKTRIKAKEKNGIVTVKAMAKHEMLSGVEAKKAGKEMNFITHLKAEAGGKVVFEVSMSQFLSKDPYISFDYPGKKGDQLTISWVDLKGNTQSDTDTVK